MDKLVTGLSSATMRKLAVAAARYNLSGNSFVRGAIDAALATCSERDGTLHAMFERIDSEHPLQTPRVMPSADFDPGLVSQGGSAS